MYSPVGHQLAIVPLLQPSLPVSYVIWARYTDWEARAAAKHFLTEGAFECAYERSSCLGRQAQNG